MVIKQCKKNSLEITFFFFFFGGGRERERKAVQEHAKGLDTVEKKSYLSSTL